MATQTKTVSGSTTSYLITDESGNTLTVAATSAVTGITVLFTSSANGLLQDGQQTLTTLMQLISTGLLP